MRGKELKLLSDRAEHYKYYELEDIKDSPGCTLCRTQTKWSASIFKKDFQKEQHKKCISCKIFYMLKLNKIYAEKLNKYDWMYEDDGK